eukprot:scaffold92634_cov29-Tisochrysis_lutea.AAC.3
MARSLARSRYTFSLSSSCLAARPAAVGSLLLLKGSRVSSGGRRLCQPSMVWFSSLPRAPTSGRRNCGF